MNIWHLSEITSSPEALGVLRALGLIGLKEALEVLEALEALGLLGHPRALETLMLAMGFLEALGAPLRAPWDPT